MPDGEYPFHDEILIDSIPLRLVLVQANCAKDKPFSFAKTSPALINGKPFFSNIKKHGVFPGEGRPR
jgi:hypothetical protein